MSQSRRSIPCTLDGQDAPMCKDSTSNVLDGPNAPHPLLLTPRQGLQQFAITLISNKVAFNFTVRSNVMYGQGAPTCINLDQELHQIFWMLRMLPCALALAFPPLPLWRTNHNHIALKTHYF